VARNAYVPEYQDTAAKVVGLYLIGKDAFAELFSLTGIGEAGVLFTLPLLLLFAVGLFGRKGPLFWFAALGCVIGLTSQFGKIQGSRHILGWLPWFAVILAVGADTIARFVSVPRSRCSLYRRRGRDSWLCCSAYRGLCFERFRR
jgi:hypothetical protein